MATVPYPKIWVSGEVLTAADLNAEFAAVNNIAGIAGSALLAQAVDTAQIKDAAVTTAKLAPNSVSQSKIGDTATVVQFFNSLGTAITPIGTNTTLVSQTLTMTRTTIRILASLNGVAAQTTGTGISFTAELLRDGTVKSSTTNLGQSLGGIGSSTIAAFLPFVDNPGPGVHTYLLRLSSTGGAQTTVVDGKMLLEEIA